MKAAQKLHELGQRIWLDNITRDLLNDGTLACYIDELSVTGLTSNPTIFDHAIKNSTAYDAALADGAAARRSAEDRFFDVAVDDLTRAADLFGAIDDRTTSVDGWVSLEVSPLLAHDSVCRRVSIRTPMGRVRDLAGGFVLLDDDMFESVWTAVH